MLTMASLCCNSNFLDLHDHRYNFIGSSCIGTSLCLFNLPRLPHTCSSVYPWPYSKETQRPSWVPWTVSVMCLSPFLFYSYVMYVSIFLYLLTCLSFSPFSSPLPSMVELYYPHCGSCVDFMFKIIKKKFVECQTGHFVCVALTGARQYTSPPPPPPPP